MASLTQKLRRCNTSSDDSILFHHQAVPTNKRRRHNNDNLTYKQCFEIINEHERWLVSTIHTQLQSYIHDATNKNSSIKLNDFEVKDVIIGYLSNNEPDLLLSMLACINLTTTTSEDSTKVLPAMINARWTPKEIMKALSPSASSAERNGTHHVTIVLYGEGYEQTAKQAVQLMNTKHHYAVAVEIPTLSDRYYTSTSVSVVSDSLQQTTPNSQQTTQHESLNNKSTQISNSTAILLFTSGTSSPNGAKGVCLSHKSLYIQSQAKTQYPCNYNKDTYMIATTVPWFHVGGLSSVLAVMFAGGMLVFPPQDDEDVCRGVNGTVKKERKGFQPQNILQSIQPKDSTMNLSANISANTLVVVPAMLHSIVEYHNKLSSHQPTIPANYPNIKLILVGGQSIGSGKLYKSIRNLFPKARIVQTYACTEAGSSITFEDLGYWNGVSSTGKSVDYMLERKEVNDGSDVNDEMMDGATCVGLPPSHIEIGIFNTEQVALPNASNSTRKQLPNGQMGIIGTCGTHTMSGYWNRGDQSSNKKSQQNENEWMLTNDLGYIHPITDKLYFCGRANDVIRTGGESVLATEVERVIGMYDGIEECAVFALPDVKFGEAVCVAVVLSSSAASASENVVVEDDQMKHKLRAYCSKQQLAGFKQPRRVFHMKSLPRNSSGKVLKHEIIRLCASISKSRSRL